MTRGGHALASKVCGTGLIAAVLPQDAEPTAHFQAIQTLLKAAAAQDEIDEFEFDSYSNESYQHAATAAEETGMQSPPCQQKPPQHRAGDDDAVFSPMATPNASPTPLVTPLKTHALKVRNTTTTTIAYACPCGKRFKNALGLGGHKATCKASFVSGNGQRSAAVNEAVEAGRAHRKHDRKRSRRATLSSSAQSSTQSMRTGSRRAATLESERFVHSPPRLFRLFARRTRFLITLPVLRSSPCN
jgi:hypothetical protein